MSFYCAKLKFNALSFLYCVYIVSEFVSCVVCLKCSIPFLKNIPIFFLSKKDICRYPKMSRRLVLIEGLISDLTEYSRLNDIHRNALTFCD